MGRRFGNVIYIDRNPNNPDEGWGWVEVTTEDVKRFGIPKKHPATRRVTKTKEIIVTRYKDSIPYTETYINTYEDFVHPPSRGKAGAKKFTLNIDGKVVAIRAQKSLTIQALCAWIKTWASPNTKIVTPGNRTLSLDGEKLAHQAHFVYFILNKDSNAVKIGRAKDLEKRMKALQTSSPAELKLIKSVQVEGREEAHELEQSLHKQFSEIRLAGEWFKAEANLLEYISQL
ncbi:MAG: GIY-YIG nuclease family protein [Synechococcales cyanobacterium RM1_1_8]|nr:GIY-YIG nuclease family protein [Synechococcales cyanobacterium RM1_1_8]